ncbi:hypothetical protein [Amycolatopsis cihanbeyliensis]|uniref:HTH cro/C1-type domain-containing protein n=1 Tax=Amycolatopsis cihanbeyliensis TaxID=1128664 RepID=A0A542DEV3_AMYCI|nr:hypothetical protein [Amycolatopsis cihanbeyliensis]TQJ01584.1 hypothetical protein FB471_1277 [Amycolatopsis cihanbeyliensis]
MSTDRDTGARLLRQLREGRGWSWADLARALRDTARQLAVTSLTHRQVTSIQRTVARWESGTERTSPGDRYQVLLAHLYARTPSGDLALGPGSDLGTLLDALRHFGTPPHRIQALLDLVTQNARSDSSTLLSPATHSGITAIQRDLSPLDHDLLGQLQRSVTAITRQVGSTPFVRLQLQLAPIVESCRRLLQRDHPGQHDELVRLTTHTYALAARLAFETRDDQLATALYTDATAVAGQLKDRNHRATVRTSHTMVTLHATNDLDTARTIAHAATIDAHQGSSYAVRARAHAVHAEICARADQTREAGAALDRAWRTVEQLTADDPHSGFNADRLHGFDGLCALHAGDANRAHDSLAHSLNALKTSRDAVQRGIVSTDLALARLRLGDPAACADLLHKAIDITATTGGRVPAQRIRLARQHLRPWRTEHFLTELDDHIHDTLIGR